MTNILTIIAMLLMTIFSVSLQASKLISVKVVDKEHIMLFFKDGDVIFNENIDSPRAFTNSVRAEDNTFVPFGNPLNISVISDVTKWIISSPDDPDFSETGVHPADVYRKSKLTCMAMKNWNQAENDYDFDWAYEHTVFLRLPNPMQQGYSYKIEIDDNINSDVNTKTITYDIFNNKSEAVRVNIVGYSTRESIKSVDVYMWLGDGGPRNYSSFEGNKVYINNIETGEKQEVGELQFWKQSASETSSNHKMIQGDVWSADFSSINTPGKYRIIVEDIGCSDDFVIADDIYAEPTRVNTLGFFYMRIGQDNLYDMVPVPRRPLYIPGVSPSNTVVYITTMHPYHPEWSTFAGGDRWDRRDEWANYVKPGNPTNPNAYGGHSDALDWDRHLGHVSIIYDLLFPYIITGGILNDDNMGIPESGNGIPDILDEARNEVDFWLRLRDGLGYSHGINNPNSSNVFYQAGITAVAAWANAANAAMLSNAFLISGNTDLMEVYRDSAMVAYNFASNLPDQMLDNSQGIGIGRMTGRDFKATAAAYLYNITGETSYEDDLESLCRVTSATSAIQTNDFNQLYALAAYLFTRQEVHYPELYNNMKQALIREAKIKEANYSNIRPSKRATDNDNAWFVTFLQVQRTILAHAISDPGSSDRTFFENALTLEADWSLGRNPLNMILMTTATTGLEDKKSVPNAYTSGWNDGTPGVHPGHTPYMNINDWGGGIRGNPSWMTQKNYPNVSQWPYGEMYYNTRYVWAANEFTPQQTMRGKQALYSYLYALSKPQIISASGVTIYPKNNSLGLGDSLSLTAIVTPDNVINNNVRWSSNNTKIATIDANGIVRGKGEGSVLIKAFAMAGNAWDTTTINIKRIDISEISIQPDTIVLKEGEKFQLSVLIEPSNASDQNIIWKTEDPNVAVVNSEGLVTAISSGTVKIMATTNDAGISATAIVIVEISSGAISNKNTNGIKLFPNPAKNIIKIELPLGIEKGILEIYDLTGKTVKSIQLEANHNSINIEDLKSDVYFFHLRVKNHKEVFKVIIE